MLESDKSKTVVFAVILSAFPIFLLEVAIRLTGVYHTQSEKGSLTFTNPYKPQRPGWFYTQQPSLDAVLTLPEFSFRHHYDSLGFRNDTVQNPYDVIAFGDSFTEGLGAPQDSTWPARYASLSGQKVYNAGVMGCDPFYNYKALERLMFLHPKYVIFSVNFSDIYDVNARGGFSRFVPGDHIRYSDPPWYLPLYRYSHVFRAFLHFGLGYDFMFNSPGNRQGAILKNIRLLQEALTTAQEFCEKENIGMFVFINPLPHEYYKNLDRRVDFKAIDTLAAMLSNEGVAAWNLRPDFQAALKKADDWRAVSWEKDGHFNGKGYQLMARLMYDKLKDNPLVTSHRTH